MFVASTAILCMNSVAVFEYFYELCALAVLSYNYYYYPPITAQQVLLTFNFNLRVFTAVCTSVIVLHCQNVVGTTYKKGCKSYAVEPV